MSRRTQAILAVLLVALALGLPFTQPWSTDDGVWFYGSATLEAFATLGGFTALLGLAL